MAQQIIGIGSSANDGTGDDPRTAGGKINSNFTEVYAGLIPDSAISVYVSKQGNDSNDGLTPAKAKLTIASAITAASALLATADQAVVKVMDAGTYTEDLTIPDNIYINGLQTTIVGNHTLADNSTLIAHTLMRGSGASELVDKTGSPDTHGYVWCFRADSRGTAGTLTGNSAFRNSSSGSILHVHCPILYVGASTIGLTDGGTGTDFGHIHFEGDDIYLTGNGATGCRTGSGGSKLLVNVHHIVELGTPSNTEGLSLNHADSEVWFNGVQIVADSAWDISSGSLYNQCGDVRGTKAGTAVYDASLFPDLLRSKITAVGSDTVQLHFPNSWFSTRDPGTWIRWSTFSSININTEAYYQSTYSKVPKIGDTWWMENNTGTDGWIAASSAADIDFRGVGIADSATTKKVPLSAGEVARITYLGSDAWAIFVSKIFADPRVESGDGNPLELTDSGKTVVADSATAHDIIISAEADENYLAGTRIRVINKGAGLVSLVGDTGVTVNGTLAGTFSATAQWQILELEKIGSDEWVVA